VAHQPVDPRPGGISNSAPHYFDLVTDRCKTIEVQYPNLRDLKAGDHIRFVCGRDDTLTKHLLTALTWAAGFLRTSKDVPARTDQSRRGVTLA
jgi:hypothetical protein